MRAACDLCSSIEQHRAVKTAGIKGLNQTAEMQVKHLMCLWIWREGLIQCKISRFVSLETRNAVDSVLNLVYINSHHITLGYWTTVVRHRVIHHIGLFVEGSSLSGNVVNSWWICVFRFAPNGHLRLQVARYALPNNARNNGCERL